MDKTTISTLLAVGAATGALVTLAIVNSNSRNQRNETRGGEKCCKHVNDDLQEANHRRARLPSIIIMVRHGESEGNADHTLYRTKPDNLVGLTETGKEQGQVAGKRVESVFQTYEKTGCCKIERVHLIVSPFERTLQTASTMRSFFEHRIVRTDIQPRIREQEFGNLQDEDFVLLRNEQKRVGRFWYRFPTGESGADVYDRVKSWWFDAVLNVNERVGYDPVDALVVVTHGLTMRFVLMQLYNWSPTTFHSVWNAGNCDLYVLAKDLKKPGMSPYVLDNIRGDQMKSSINLMVEFKSKAGSKQIYKLQDYLSIPPPRTTRLELIKKKLAEQHPDIDAGDIESIAFMPFIDGALIQGRSPSGVSDEKRFEGPMSFTGDLKRVRPEMSCRFPNFSWPESSPVD